MLGQAWHKGPSGASHIVLPGEDRPDWLQCPVGVCVKHGSQFCMVTQSEKLYPTIVGELQVAPPYVCNGHGLRAFYRSSYWRPEFPCMNKTSRVRRYRGRRHQEGHTVRGRYCWDSSLQNAMTQAKKERCGAFSTLKTTEGALPRVPSLIGQWVTVAIRSKEDNETADSNA